MLLKVPITGSLSITVILNDVYTINTLINIANMDTTINGRDTLDTDCDSSA
ncbi:hypothetical protein D3C78_1099890 [compost metagenome]